MPIRVRSASSTDTLEQVGRRLRVIRELAGVTQEALCEVLHVDQSTYSKWEKGKRLPDVLVLIKFAARFRTSLDFLFRGAPIGMHPELLHLLRLGHPGLVADIPTGMDQDRDMALSSYRAAIVLEDAQQA